MPGSGHHCRHSPGSAGAPLRLDAPQRSWQGRAWPDGAVPTSWVDAHVASRHLARPSSMPREASGVRSVPGVTLVPCVRRRPHGSGRGRAPGPWRGAGM